MVLVKFLVKLIVVLVNSCLCGSCVCMHACVCMRVGCGSYVVLVKLIVVLVPSCVCRLWLIVVVVNF